MSEYVEIHGADLVEMAVLAVELEVSNIPEEMRPRKINIGNSEETKHDTKQQLNETNVVLSRCVRSRISKKEDNELRIWRLHDMLRDTEYRDESQ